MIIFTVALIIKLIVNFTNIDWVDWTSGVAFGVVGMYWFIHIIDK